MHGRANQTALKNPFNETFRFIIEFEYTIENYFIILYFLKKNSIVLITEKYTLCKKATVFVVV